MCYVRETLNNVILGSGDTCASEKFHFPEVKSTVHVHLFDFGAPLNQGGNAIIIINNNIPHTDRASLEIP